MDSLLSSIAARNRSIHAQEQRVDAGHAMFQTGLSLADPKMNLDWMQGFPSSAGSQTDLTIAQPFDFPSVYKYRREVAELKATRLDLTATQVRKEVLLEAKRVALDLVYLNKSRHVLIQRLADTEAFYKNYQTRLEQQDATILDVRKAQLRLINIRTELQLIESRIQASLQKLTELNGGETVAFADTTYPEILITDDYVTLERTIEDNDPALQSLMMLQRISAAETRLTRSLLLPVFEAGYRYQGLLGQNFHGIHVGMSVPLWENKKRLNASELNEEVYAAQIEEHRTEHASRIAILYDRYQALQQNLDSYRTALAAVSDQTLLTRALQEGQITVLDYFLETTIYYESMDRYLELEASLQHVVAELLQYRL